MQWAEIARRQAGVVSRRQLLAAGYSAARIAALRRGRRLETTRWPGVYWVVGAAMTPEVTQWAAVLDANAVLSYLSAATWWEVPVPPDGRIHVTAPRRRRTNMPAGLRVHRVALDEAAVTECFGMPITTRVETLLDCLGWLPLREASTLADRAFQQRWLLPADAERRLSEQPGRWGNRQLARLLGQAAPGAHAESERRLIRMLRRSGVRGWVPNYPISLGGRRYSLDIAFPERRLAIEVDGWAFHSTVDRFRADRAKQNALIGAGWRVLRFTWWDLMERPGPVIATITALLAA